MCKYSRRSNFFETEKRVTESAAEMVQNRRTYHKDIRKLKIYSALNIFNTAIFLALSVMIISLLASKSPITGKSVFMTFYKFDYEFFIFLNEASIFLMILQIIYKCCNTKIYLVMAAVSFIGFVLAIFFAKGVRSFAPFYIEATVLSNFLIIALSAVSPNIVKDFDALYIVAYVLSVAFFSLAFLIVFVSSR